MAGIEIVENNIGHVLDELSDTTETILEIIGMKAEKYAKALCPVGTPESTGIKGYRGSTLKNSITHEVYGDELVVGSDVEYAPYVELGTGQWFNTPPEWEKFTTEKGSGKGHGYVHPRPYLRPAFENHLSHYKKIIESQLKK